MIRLASPSTLLLIAAAWLTPSFAAGDDGEPWPTAWDGVAAGDIPMPAQWPICYIARDDPEWRETWRRLGAPMPVGLLEGSMALIVISSPVSTEYSCRYRVSGPASSGRESIYTVSLACKKPPLSEAWGSYLPARVMIIERRDRAIRILEKDPSGRPKFLDCASPLER